MNYEGCSRRAAGASSTFPVLTTEQVHPARLSMLPASMRWKVLPRQQLLSLPRPGCASMSSLRGTIETGMLNRFAGTPENKADLISRVPMKRIAQPEEIAEAILFLASDVTCRRWRGTLRLDGSSWHF